MSDWEPDIFEYLDYRAYLADYYTAAKANMPAFSYRYFSRKAGYSSPNFLKLVIEGKRNISADSVDRFGKALQLDRKTKRFFADLVAFDQSETLEDKTAAFERVTASRRFRSARRLDQAFFFYLNRWYYPVIREMAARQDFREDPDWIAEQLLPPIAPEEARECLDMLLEMGLLIRNEDGGIERGEASLTTGHEAVRAMAIVNYHRMMMQRAADTLTTVKSTRRDISALTVCISPDRIAEFKERIHAFRETMLDLGDSDGDPQLVYQLNIQLFPLSQTHAEEESS